MSETVAEGVEALTLNNAKETDEQVVTGEEVTGKDHIANLEFGRCYSTTLNESFRRKKR